MLESGSWEHSVLQTPALVYPYFTINCRDIPFGVGEGWGGGGALLNLFYLPLLKRCLLLKEKNCTIFRRDSKQEVANVVFLAKDLPNSSRLFKYQNFTDTIYIFHCHVITECMKLL